jgi:hypothetical protein
MRRTTCLALAALTLLAPSARAGTPMWVPTFVAENGTNTYADSVAAGTAVVVLGGSNVVVSSDFGTTWTPLSPLAAPPNGGSSETRVALSSPTRWFAANGSAVSLTNDAGTTWRPQRVGGVTGPISKSFEWATDIGAADGAPSAAVGWSGARIRGLCPWALEFTPVFSTRDRGSTWRRTDLPVTGDITSVEWLDAKHAALVVTELEWSEPEMSGDGSECTSKGTWVANSVWTTADGGVSWRQAMRTTEWYAVAAWSTPTSLAVVVESKGVAHALVSSDSGRTFRAGPQIYANPGGFNGFPTLEFVTGRRGWVGAILGGVHRTDSGGSEWVHEASPADGAFYGVPHLTAMTRDRAVFAGPSAVVTRMGEAPAAPSSSLSASSGSAGLPAPLTSMVRVGAVSRTLTLPPLGPPTAVLRVASGA